MLGRDIPQSDRSRTPDCMIQRQAEVLPPRSRRTTTMPRKTPRPAAPQLTLFDEGAPYAHPLVSARSRVRRTAPSSTPEEARTLFDVPAADETSRAIEETVPALTPPDVTPFAESVEARTDTLTDHGLFHPVDWHFRSEQGDFINIRTGEICDEDAFTSAGAVMTAEDDTEEWDFSQAVADEDRLTIRADA
jgi:hypothetical protein